ncbi:MAG TPA: DUF3500 domain-containing protein, partial [Polyangia bacterium]
SGGSATGGGGGGGAAGGTGGTAPSNNDASVSDGASDLAAGKPDGNPTTPDAAAGGDTMAICREMVDAATAFVGTIQADAAKRGAALLPFAMRRHFKYTPGDRPGLPLRNMTADQRAKALAFVKTGLSESGLRKADGIRSLELVLRAQENSNARDPDGYFLAIYGQPGTTGDWAWHFEGHHLSLHYTLSDCVRVVSVPALFSTNPAQVQTAVAGAPPVGTRVLAKEEDLARELATLLNADPQKRGLAILAGQSRDVPDSAAKPTRLTPAGLPASAMNAAEQAKLKDLIAEYASAMAAPLAAERLQRIQDAGFDKVTFLWSGSIAPTAAPYYRVQGPTFLIEYLDAGNHLHTAWREFTGDFGDDVIQKHIELFPH